MKPYSMLAATALCLILTSSPEAMARGGVYFSGRVVGVPAYYPYPPYYPAYPYYAYPPPGYAYGPPPGYAPPPYYPYAAPVAVAPAPVVAGVGVGIRVH